MKHWKLRYKEPADSWIEAMPLGNGRLGALIYGGREERISLNLSNLWSGCGKEKGNPSGLVDWEAIRQAIYDGQYGKAEELIRISVLGDWTEAYLPAATLHIFLDQRMADKDVEYERELDISEAIYREACRTEGNGWHKEAFVDFRHNALVLSLTAEGETDLSLSVSLDSPLHCELAEQQEENTLTLRGKAPVYVAPDYYECEEPVRYSQEGMEFEIGLRVKVLEGTLRKEGERIVVEKAKRVILFAAGNTSFSGGEEPKLLEDDSWRQAVGAALSTVCETEYETLKEANKTHYQSLFNRMELELGEDREEDISTSERLKNFAGNSEDTGLMALMFHYGRYLLIASSVPDGECANLQGIWNESLRAPWSSNYTVNINTQMNNWPVEACNLSELHEPLFGLMKRTAKRGRETAEKLYGLKGWVSHHNIDIWGHSTPVGYYGKDANPCVYSMWNMSSGWMCRHLWEHYCYTLDKDFLEKDAYPLVEGAVEFYLGYLQEKDGVLVTVPSTSPENLFLDEKGEPHAVTMSSTMDVAILRELFEYYIKMCDILEKTENADRCKEALSKLPKYQIGKHGQLQEWYRDYGEADVNHRHVSHLYGLYPSNTIRKEDEELRNACRVTLERRGSDGTGWCIAWKAALWARLGDGNRMMELLKKQLRFTDCKTISMKGGGTYANLFCAHPPFQIDGNFGYTAAVTEAILQSHEDRLVLLPALPDEWAKGRVKGIRARGGFTLEYAWEDKEVKELQIDSQGPTRVTVFYNGKEEKLTFTEEKLSIRL